MLVADRASRTTETAIAATHQVSPPRRRSRSISRESTRTSTIPEASTGCTTLTGSNVSTMVWQASPVSISANPVSHARLVSRLTIICGTRRMSRAGICPRARFSSTSPTL